MLYYVLLPLHICGEQLVKCGFWTDLSPIGSEGIGNS